MAVILMHAFTRSLVHSFARCMYLHFHARLYVNLHACSFVHLYTQIFAFADSLTRTRPDTRPPVADRWAGAEMHVFTLFNSWSRTDQPTDGRMDGRTKPLIELRVRN